MKFCFSKTRKTCTAKYFDKLLQIKICKITIYVAPLNDEKIKKSGIIKIEEIINICLKPVLTGGEYDRFTISKRFREIN